MGLGLGLADAIGTVLGLGDLFGSTAAVAGATDVGATAAADLGTAGLTDLGALGTAQAFVDPSAAAAAASSGALGPTSLGTAADFLAAPAAVGEGLGAVGGFGTAADAALSNAASSGLASGTGAITATPSAATGLSELISGTPAALSPTPVQPASTGNVFSTGTSPVPGVSSSGLPAPTTTTPAGISSQAASAPAGLATTPDPTALGTGSQVPGATGATSANGAPVASPPSSISQLLSNAGNKALSSVTSNPLGTALGIGGLAYNIYQGQQQTANQKALQADAATNTANSTALTNQGEALTQYLQNGTLPPAYQQQVDQAINDAITNAKSNAAAQGQSTDPTQNTSLAATIAGIENQRGTMTAQIAQTLFSSGSSLINAGQSASGLSGNLYSTLVQNDTASAANTGKAIATLAAALNSGSTGKAGQSINVGGSTLTVT